MKIGYARVSTDDQRLDLQTAALRHAGCAAIHSDIGISGKTMRRPGLEKALRSLKRGDTLVVWRLDRLGRSLVGLVKLVDELGKRGIEFVSITEAIDTSSSGGRLLFHMMAALAEFERSLISERTRAGMEVARQQGRHVGRPPALDAEAIEAAGEAIYRRGESPKSVAARLGVTLRTLRKWLDAGTGGCAAACAAEAQ